MPETTPLIKAALNLRGGAGFDVYAFAMAVDDDLLRKNPFDFERAKVLINDAVKRDALTAKNRFAYL